MNGDQPFVSSSNCNTTFDKNQIFLLNNKNYPPIFNGGCDNNDDVDVLTQTMSAAAGGRRKLINITSKTFIFHKKNHQLFNSKCSSRSINCMKGGEGGGSCLNGTSVPNNGINFVGGSFVAANLDTSSTSSPFKNLYCQCKHHIKE